MDVGVPLEISESPYTMSTMTPRSYTTLIKRFSSTVAGWFRPAFTRFLNPVLHFRDLATDFLFYVIGF